MKQFVLCREKNWVFGKIHCIIFQYIHICHLSTVNRFRPGSGHIGITQLQQKRINKKYNKMRKNFKEIQRTFH